MKYYITKTKYNCGIDLHSREMYICVMDEQGNTLVHCNIRANNFDYFLKRVEPYRDDLTVVCECTFNWYWLADACEEAGIEFVLAHSLYTALIHGSKNKNDKIDSQKLAHLLRSNLIPPAYVYPAKYRPVRTLLRQRIKFVQNRAALLIYVGMGQSSEGLIPEPKGGRDRDDWLERIQDQMDNPHHQLSMGCSIEIIKAYDKELYRLDHAIKRFSKTYRGADYQLLTSIPGIGSVLAATILLEIDTVARFPTVKDFSSYCRLVKGSVSSAGKFKGLTGAKMGNAYLRWAFGEAAVICKRNHPLITPYAERLTSKKGKFKANAILANKLGRSVYYMLQKGTSFDPEQFISS